jgi:endonuclease G
MRRYIMRRRGRRARVVGRLLGLAVLAAVVLVLARPGLVRRWSRVPRAPSRTATNLPQSPSGLVGEDSAAFAGLPAGGHLTVLRNEAFVVGYDEARKDPAWVAYRLAGPATFTGYTRLSRFTVDERTATRVRSGDYTNTGYTRGHMAPSYGIYSRYGPDAQRETYAMSNICPQLAELNSGRWQQLEVLVAGRGPSDSSWAEEYGEVWVIAGPIFDADRTFLPAGVEIPDAFYKIVLDVDERSGRPRALAFIMPKSAAAEELAAYLVSVDEVESRTGLDFFWQLDDELETELERAPAERLWN